jgi:hypothetical protein
MPLAHGTGVVPEVRPPPEEETAFVSIQTTPILARLLPDATLLRLEACAIDDAIRQIARAVRSTQATGPCPLCTTPARRSHSDYERTLADLPWAHYYVRLQLHVRKWFGRNRHCPRRIFTARLPTVAAPWARRTLRLAQRLLTLGAALSGRAGVHLGHAWDLAVSRRSPPLWCLGWTISPCGKARPMGRC